ncbi:MAG: hypothetical protein Q9169_003786 [Polycauliona sp. 2 TL-2023]
MESSNQVLNQILRAVQSVENGHKKLADEVLSIRERLEVLAQQQGHSEEDPDTGTTTSIPHTDKQVPLIRKPTATPKDSSYLADPGRPPKMPSVNQAASSQRSTATSLSSRIILTTYPGQAGIDPLPMNWGHYDPVQRVHTISRTLLLLWSFLVAKAQSNAATVYWSPHTTHTGAHWKIADSAAAIGAHGGSYSVYHALAVASKDLDVDHRPDFTNSEPAVNLGPFPQWADAKRIVSLDPLGHLSPWLFDSMVRNDNIHIRPTIAITKAHMKLPELEQSVRNGRLKPDGKICLNDTGELAVTKFAVEPVWFLPGIAERFGIDEGSLRRSLFENTGGSYPELITRGDMKLFLPPIGGLTVYCFGDPSKMSDPNVKLALRIHDECNGSDVFGSDIWKRGTDRESQPRHMQSKSHGSEQVQPNTSRGPKVLRE